MLLLLCSCSVSVSTVSESKKSLYILNDEEFCYRDHVYLTIYNVPAFGVDDRPIKCKDLK